MYYISAYEFNLNKSKTVMADTERNCLSFMETYCYDYIRQMVGEIVNHGKLYYEHGCVPSKRKCKLYGRFFIQKCELVNGYIVKERIEEKGWIYNSHKIVNHFFICCTRLSDFKYEEFRRPKVLLHESDIIAKFYDSLGVYLKGFKEK